MPEILVVSDTHLSPKTPEALHNWDAVVAFVEQDRPDLVIHTGDISLQGLHSPAELDLPRAELDRLAVPWLAVPGNHDIGDIGGTTNAIDDGRRAAYEDRIGPRSWTRQVGRWRLIGFDSQDLLSDEVRGRAVIDWLASEICGPHPIALFQHRPLLPVDDPDGDTSRRYVTEPMRAPLRTLMARPEVKVVVSGHVHQWRRHTIDGTEHIWAPSTWAAITVDWQPIIGTKTVGVTRLVLDDAVSVTGDGAAVEADLVLCDGMVDHVMGDTLPSPY